MSGDRKTLRHTACGYFLRLNAYKGTLGRSVCIFVCGVVLRVFFVFGFLVFGVLTGSLRSFTRRCHRKALQSFVERGF